MGNDLNGKISMGTDGFMKVNIEDSKIRSFSFPENVRNDQFVKMRLLGKNVNLDGISIDSFDLYILENQKIITFDDTYCKRIITIRGIYIKVLKI